MNSNQTRLDGLTHMTADWVYLSDVAAKKLMKNSSVDGEKKLQELAKKARMEIYLRVYSLLTITFLSMLALAIYFICAVSELIDFQWYEHFSYQNFGHYSVYILPTVPRLITCVICGVVSFLMLYLIQHQEPFKSWFRLSNACYPQELEALFADLQGKEWQAKTNDGRLPAHLFSSSWRTMLAVGPDIKFWRQLIWDKKGRAYNGDIEIKHKAYGNENQQNGDKCIPEHLEVIINADRSVDHEEENVIKHWRSSVPPNQREAFCATFAAEGGWKGDDAKKIIIALQAVFSYDGKMKSRGGRETLPPLIGAAVAALRRAVEDGQIETFWLSDAHRSDPSSSLEKMLGDTKDHKYTQIRIKTFKILGIRGS